MLSGVGAILNVGTTTRKRMSKYSSKKAIADGITFDSTIERDRYLHLKLLERAGEISGLEVQPIYELIPKQQGERGIKYVADFRYQSGIQTVVEDIKSIVTAKLPAYILKRKMMLFFHGIKVKQVMRKQKQWVEL